MKRPRAKSGASNRYRYLFAGFLFVFSLLAYELIAVGSNQADNSLRNSLISSKKFVHPHNFLVLSFFTCSDESKSNKQVSNYLENVKFFGSSLDTDEVFFMVASEEACFSSLDLQEASEAFEFIVCSQGREIYELTLRAQDFQVERVVFVHPERFKLYPELAQENVLLYEPLHATVASFVKSRVSTWDESSPHDFSNPFDHQKDPKNFKSYDKFFKEVRNSATKLTEYKKLISIDASLLQNLEQLVFFALDSESFNKLDFNQFQIDDDRSGNLALRLVLDGNLETSLRLIKGYYSRRSSPSKGPEVDKSTVERLRNIRLLVNELHFDRFLTKFAKLNSRGEPDWSLDEQRFIHGTSFHFRSHNLNERIFKTSKAWSKRLEANKIPFILDVPSIDGKETKQALKEVKGEFKVNVVNAIDAKWLLPQEIVSGFDDWINELKINKFYVKQIGDKRFFDLSIDKNSMLWLFTQITWMPVFAQILKNDPKDDDYFWFIDYDVTFTGDILELIKLTDGIEADFMASSQVTENVKNQKDFDRLEREQTHTDWKQYGWGATWLKKWQKNGVYPEDPVPLDYNEFLEKHIRKSYANSLRLSGRMIRWVMEALLIPDYFFWGWDEVFYRSICFVHKECVYVPFNAIPVNNGENINTEDISTDLVFNYHRLTSFSINRGKERSDIFVDLLNKGKTKNHLWHAIKSTNLDPHEIWLD